MTTDRPLLGRTLLFCSGMVGVVALTVFLFVPRVELAAWFASPNTLLLIVAVNILIAIMRIGSTELAWRDGGGRGWVVAAALGVFIAIPHVAIAWVGMETRNSLLTVFSPQEVTRAALPPSTTTTSTTTPIELTPIVTLPGQYANDVVNAEKTAPWRPFGEERLNIMILGGDAGPGRGGLRTDTIMVTSIDPISGDTVLFGLPRNYGGLYFTNGDPIPVRRLNHVYGWGRTHPDAFGGVDPGSSAVRDAVQNITGLEIDHFVMVDLTGFADVIDVFGGVTLDVPTAVDGPLYDVVTGGYEMIEILPGTQTLDGGHALAYARARYGSSDYERMGRQRCILTSMVRQADPLSIFTNIGGVLGVVEENVTTDMPVDMVPDLVRLLFKVSGERIRVAGFDSTWKSGVTGDGHPIPDVTRIREAVRQLVEEPDTATAVDITTASESCG